MQAYVTQDDILTGTLTVRETIQYAAQLQLPSSLSKADMNNIVEQTILEMGLRTCADTKVGNWHLKGLSGGERRRLSIAVEVLTRPRLMYLDEPTSGLDRCVWNSSNAHSFIYFMKRIRLFQFHDHLMIFHSIHVRMRFPQN